jgi:hypothetical protein
MGLLADTREYLMYYRATRFRAGRLIWLLTLPPSPVSLSFELTDGRGGEVKGKEPNYTTARKPGPLKYIHYSLAGTARNRYSNRTVKKFMQYP